MKFSLAQVQALDFMLQSVPDFNGCTPIVKIDGELWSGRFFKRGEAYKVDPRVFDACVRLFSDMLRTFGSVNHCKTLDRLPFVFQAISDLGEDLEAFSPPYLYHANHLPTSRFFEEVFLDAHGEYELVSVETGIQSSVISASKIACGTITTTRI